MRSSRDGRVLLVDDQPEVFELASTALRDQSLTLIQVGTVAEARVVLSKKSIDVALIEPAVDGAQGMALARELRGAGGDSITQTILLCGQPSMEQAIEAIAAGVGALLVKPVGAEELVQQVRQALARSSHRRLERSRFRRLKRVCRKLDEARKQVTQQVDILCNDLVSAYQELAGQMQQLAQTTEYAAIVDKELDLELLLRKTLEFVLQKAGPTNAAIFLPSNHDEYTVGAYVNYDTTSDAAGPLLDHLADVMAARIGQRDSLLHLTDNDTLAQWIGDDVAYLADCHLLAFPARQEDETLAVVALFRDGSEPFDAQAVEACAAIAPMLAQFLTRIIRVHHRHLDDLDDGGEDVEGQGEAEPA